MISKPFLPKKPFIFVYMTHWPDFTCRSEASEWMDDPSIPDDLLAHALTDLRHTNRLLGAYRATDAVLDPLLRRREAVRILDLGCGGGDYLAHFVRRGARLGCRVQVVGLDANPVTIGHARAHLDADLSPALRSRARAEIGDALSTGCAADAFDITHAALFLHHLHGPAAPQLLREMNRVSCVGLIVNDLHRHPLAWAGIWLLSRALRMAPMVQHDGPISVLRGFHRHELEDVARAAALPTFSIRWHWAFRWTLSTIRNS